MIDPTPRPLDPAVLAKEVRDLAHEAHRVLNAPAIEVLEIDDLSRRIASLQEQIRGYSFNSLACWLDNVRQRIEEK
jgi:hypothetical protein